ncbi:MAG: DNA polymerase III subunit beta [Spirochaetes bacterium]|nr:DNA polymerase III subunit beta [Spirochaetota bacterium]
MRIEVDKIQMIKATTIADSVVSAKSINTILTQCLFNVNGDNLTITGTDNEIGIKTQLDVISDGTCSFTINGKRLVGLLKEFPDGVIILEVNNTNISISSKSGLVKGQYVLVGSSAEEYPSITECDFKNAIEIEQKIFKEMISKTVHAAAHDTVKPIFNGVYIVSEDEKSITVVATDSRRLSMIKRDIAGNDLMKKGFILPLKTVNELLRLLDDKGVCLLAFDDSRCFVKIGPTVLVSRLIDGQFPDYKQVIPKDYLLKSVIEVKKLREALNRIKIFTNEPSWRILLKFSQNSLNIEASYPDQGEGQEEVSIESDSKESITIGINVQFLLDLLKEIDSFSVVMCITGVMSPVLIYPEDDINFRSVIMPIQIRSM